MTPSVNAPAFRQFLQFTKDRHEIYIKRSQGQPAPWTADPVLQEFKFCNIYRELDRGTAYFINEVTKQERADDNSGLVMSIIYRLVNNRLFFEYIGGIPELGWDMSAVVEGARVYSKQYGTFVGDSYMAFACSRKGETKADSLARVLDWLEVNFADWHSDVYSVADSPEEAHKALCKIPYVGPFIAYEIICDMFLINELEDFSINDWTNIGPGAKPALGILFPCSLSSQMDQIKEVQRLHNESDWPYEPLNLRNIEHSLCEWRKYTNLQLGTGKKRRYIQQ